MKEFKKTDLKTGDVVLQRCGFVGIVNRSFNPDFDMLICKEGYDDLGFVQEDLTSVISEKYDIVAVRRPQEIRDCQFNAFEENFSTLVYEQKEPEEMTLAEVCRLLGKEIKIIE